MFRTPPFHKMQTVKLENQCCFVIYYLSCNIGDQIGIFLVSSFKIFLVPENVIYKTKASSILWLAVAKVLAPEFIL